MEVLQGTLSALCVMVQAELHLLGCVAEAVRGLPLLGRGVRGRARHGLGRELSPGDLEHLRAPVLGRKLHLERKPPHGVLQLVLEPGGLAVVACRVLEGGPGGRVRGNVRRRPGHTGRPVHNRLPAPVLALQLCHAPACRAPHGGHAAPLV